MLFFQKIYSVNVPEAKKIIAGGNVLVIDMRSPEAYQECHIEGALLGDETNWDQFIDGLDKSKQVICYCYKGISSRTFCKKFKKAGFPKIWNLKGGFDAWQKETA